MRCGSAKAFNEDLAMTLAMQAMQLTSPSTPLRLVERAAPEPGSGQVLVEVLACGVCRTDIHVVDGEIGSVLPIVPGHEIIGRIVAFGEAVTDFAIGDRIGIPWLGRTCGTCRYCRVGKENLCDDPIFTGFSRDGGFATHAVADAGYCLRIPELFGDVEAAPLLCAGLIGYRSYRAAGDARVLGFYGFGAAAHILAQLALWEGRRVFAFTKPGDRQGQEFARSLGCAWAGGSDDAPPEALDAAIIFAPVGVLVPAALRQIRKGGRVVCAGIHMSDIPAFPYADLWQERSIVSVANLTRADGVEFLDLAAQIPIRTTTTAFPLEQANEALAAVRDGSLEGAAVLVPDAIWAGRAGP
jgi:propanol-preferring alcohol dehydrogenase